MNSRRWWRYADAQHVELVRLCECVVLEIKITEGALRWVSRRDCSQCRGGLRRLDSIALPTTPDALRAWVARGCLSSEEYREVLRYQRRVEELDVLRRDDEGDYDAYFEHRYGRRAA